MLFIFLRRLVFLWIFFLEEWKTSGILYDADQIKFSFENELKKHQELSRTAAEGKFKGGLADHSEKTTQLHTAAHLMLAGLRKVLGEHVHQKGSNINGERIRFDFSHSEKMTDEQKKAVEDYVNEAIAAGVPVIMEKMKKKTTKNLYFPLVLVMAAILGSYTALIPSADAQGYPGNDRNYTQENRNESGLRGWFNRCFGEEENRNDSRSYENDNRSNSYNNEILRRLDEDSAFRQDFTNRLNNDSSFRNMFLEQIRKSGRLGDEFANRFENDTNFRNSVLNRFNNDPDFRRQILRPIDNWDNWNNNRNNY